MGRYDLTKSLNPITNEIIEVEKVENPKVGDIVIMIRRKSTADIGIISTKNNGEIIEGVILKININNNIKTDNHPGWWNEDCVYKLKLI